jgi:hypothetical protein
MQGIGEVQRFKGRGRKAAPQGAARRSIRPHAPNPRLGKLLHTDRIPL